MNQIGYSLTKSWAINLFTALGSSTPTLSVLITVLTLAPKLCPAQQPTIASQPTQQIALVGGQAIFVVTANGMAPLLYQWRKDAVPITGATNDVLILTNTQFAAAGQYSVTVSNGLGGLVSSNAVLVVKWPQAGDVDVSFDPGASINSSVSAVAMQPDGKIIIGGSFTAVNGAARGGIARLNSDGSTDHTFMNHMSGANRDIASVVVESDGMVLIGGSFTTLNGTIRYRIARLKVDGSVDPNFQNGMSGANGDVSALAVQADGKVLVAGSFTTVNGVSRNRIARLNADGSLDTTFQNGMTGVNNDVSALAVQADGKILITGSFTTVNGVSRNRVARLSSTGSLDSTFQNGLSGADNSVRSVVLQADGKVLIGGVFTTVNGVSRNRIARLNSDGGLDTTFQNGVGGADSSISVVSIPPSGKVLIGGEFTTVNGASRVGLARLNSDGSLDTNFLNGILGAGGYLPYVYCAELQADGKLVIGGWFTTFNGARRLEIARVNIDGSVDVGFQNGTGGIGDDYFGLECLAVQADGKVVVGGGFASIAGVTRNRIGRLNADGSLDASFQDGMTGASSIVDEVKVQPDGKVLIGGDFATVNGLWRFGIARLNTDGSVDTNFLNGMTCANSAVRALALQPDGKVLIGGWFTSVNGVNRTRLARLNTDGSLDTTFQNGMSGANDVVDCAVVQADGKVLIGGWFTSVNGVTRNRIARLNSNGSLDTGFQNAMSGADNGVYSIAVQADGKVVIAGVFTTFNGISKKYVARLNPDGTVDNTFQNGMSGIASDLDVVYLHSVAVQADGKILIGGFFTSVNGITRGNIARLNADGSVDSTFLNGSAGANGAVYSVAVQADGNILIGGSFGGVNGEPRGGVARLWGGAAPPAILMNDGHFGFLSNQFGFNMVGASNQAVVTEASSNLTTWTPVRTNIFGGSPFYFSDPQSRAIRNRYYRLQVQ